MLALMPRKKYCITNKNDYYYTYYAYDKIDA